MRHSLKKVPFTVMGILSLIALTANADSADVKSQVVKKAYQSEKGVIVVVAERGDMAAKAAYLLVEQIAHNPGYSPLLMVPADKQENKTARYFSLNKSELPAVIFFSKAGKELGRVVPKKPTMVEVEVDDFKSSVSVSS